MKLDIKMASVCASKQQQVLVLDVKADTVVEVQSEAVWLTHSESAQDYVLNQSEQVHLQKGRVLIEGLHGAIAQIKIVSVDSVLKSKWHELQHHMQAVSPA